jgi:hypothetical protein
MKKTSSKNSRDTVPVSALFAAEVTWIDVRWKEFAFDCPSLGSNGQCMGISETLASSVEARKQRSWGEGVGAYVQ